MHVLSVPHPIPRSQRRMAGFPLSAALLVAVLALASFMYYTISGGPGQPEPMPAVQFAAIASPGAAECVDATPMAKKEVAGTPSVESAIQMPEGPYEVGFHVRAHALPTDGELAGKNTVNGISRTVADLITCMNEGSAQGVWALTTEDYARRFSETGRDLAEVEARAIVPLAGPTEGEMPMPEIRNVILLGDGRVGAEIHPAFDGPVSTSAIYDYYVFAEQNGRWLIDEAVHVQLFERVEVTVNDDGFSPRELNVQPQSAELVLTNEGTSIHSFYVPELGLRTEATPGESATVSLKAPAGTYEFVSDIPGDEGEEFTGTVVFDADSIQSDATPVTGENAETFITSGVPMASATIHAHTPDSYSPDRLFVLADRDVELTIVNNGSLPANFTIDELEISVDLESSGTETIVINAPAGVYAYYSNIPGHTEVGMTGTLIVKEN